MSKLLRKLKSRAGETLVESMAAILVFTFASIIMMSMVSAAADINTTAKEADRAFQNQMVVVEKGDPADSDTGGYATFTFGSVEEKIPVDVFQADEADSLYAYYESPTTPSGEAGGGTE